MEKCFLFKKFSVFDHDCGMPVSTDGVLLGAWAKGSDPKNILDIGTGTGLLALMMAQHYENASIRAIDIEKIAFNSARQNVKQSIWSNRILVEQADIRDWKNQQVFDLIVCNPPYFSSGEHSLNNKRAVARHNHNLPQLDLIKAIKSKLAKNGSAHLILPCNEASNMIQLAKEDELFCFRKTWVKTTEDKLPSRILFSLSHQDLSCLEETLIIREKNNYSQDFIKLTKDFYLKM